MDKKKKIIIISITVVIALVICIFGSYSYYQKRSQGQPTGKMVVFKSDAVNILEATAESKTMATLKKEIKARKKAEEKAQEKEAKVKEESEKETTQKTPTKSSKNGIIVALDPGHQGPHVDMSAKEPNAPGSSEMKAKSTSGTTGKYSGLGEYQLNLDVSLLLRDLLEERGYQVVLTREDNNTAISNAERAQMTSASGADICVRIHANGSENTGVQGALALVSSPSNGYVGHLYGSSYALADAVLNAYCAKTGFANKGIQQNDTMTGLNWSEIPVMILEMGFMSNQHDDLAMADPNFQVTMAQGIADGIDQYYGN